MKSFAVPRITIFLSLFLALFLVPLSAQDIIVDNDQGSPDYTETGAWTTSGSPGYNGGTYRFASAGGAHTATWTANLPSAGPYDVYAIFLAGGNRTTSTKYDISTDSGTQSGFINQTVNSLSWVKIGTYNFNAGNNTVTLDAAGSSGGSVVIADAIKFSPPPPPPPDDPAEIRLAAMTVFDNIDTGSAIQAWVDEIASLHYNSITVHTRYRGDATYYPNKVDSTFPNNEPRSTAIGSIDVLEEFVTRGHAAGLKVFAYVNVWIVTDGADTDGRPNHVINTHPEWRTYAYNNGNPVVQTTVHEGEGLWLDPALPDARDYVNNICGDIVMNYDVDGIYLDRIRYPQTGFTRTSKDFGYHPDAIAAFNSLYGKSGTPDPYDADWIQFRQDNITLTVDGVYDTITGVDPDHILIAAPIGRFNDAINFNYQDWPTWLSVGAIDGVLPQIYTSDNVSFRSRCQTHRNAYTGPRLLGVSTQAYLSGIDVDGQIVISREEGFAGQAPWRHGSMGSLGYFADLQNAWPGIAPWPDMPWKVPDTTPPAAPTNLSATGGNAVVNLDWDDNTEPDLLDYNVYRSNNPGGPYTLIDGNVVSSNYSDLSVVNDNTYYYVVTAEDASNNESSNSNEASATPTEGTPVEVIVDNDQGAPSYTETGGWNTSGSVGYNGGTYRYATAGGAHTATWTAALAAGSYEVSVIYVAGANRSPSAVYDISTAAGTQTVSVDQTQNSLVWVPVGTFDFNSGDNTITLDAERSSGASVVVIADAVKFTPASPDTTPPAAPTGLAATAGDATVSLDWADNGEGDLAGYNVYRSTTSGSGYAQINGSLVTSSAYNDNTVTNGTTYYYVVTAVDTSSNESANSNEASATPEAAPDTTPPAAPTGLGATAGDATVSLDWADNSEPDLAGYNVYRSTTSGSGYAQLNGSLVTSSAYTDNSVTNDTTYYYVVTAVDTSSNESANSNEASATPQAPGGDTENVATGETTLAGTIVAGSYVTTQVQDNTSEVIREVESGGKPSSRYSYMDHTWTFNVVAGTGYTFFVDAYHSANSEGDDFVLSYSTDNSIFIPMVTITKTSDNSVYQSYVFPEDVSGTLYVKATDTDSTSGNNSFDDLTVDHMYVLTSGGGGPDTTPPAAPTGLGATAGDGTVALDWADNGEGDLAGYNVYRSTTSGSGYTQLNGSLLTSSAYTDNSVSNGTTYYYVVTAVDTSSNESANSNEASATPSAGGAATTMHVSAITLTTVNAGGGNKRGQAQVTILDNLGNPVSGATVSGTFTGSYNESGSASTNASGVATITTSATAKGGVSFTFCVDNVSGTLTYDPNSNTVTCSSI